MTVGQITSVGSMLIKPSFMSLRQRPRDYWLPQDQEDAVSAGTYYYVVTAVNINDNESGYFNEASISVGGWASPQTSISLCRNSIWFESI